MSELGVEGSAGAGSQLSQVELAGESGAASLECSWRVQKALSVLKKEHRCPPLALRYAAPRNREEFVAREALWREEMFDTNGKANPSRGASHRWLPAPPVQPSYLLGDEHTQKLRREHFVDANDSRIELSKQAVQVQLKELQAEVSSCVTAEQAVAALEVVRTFLLSGCNLAYIDPKQATTHIKRLSLPFERLVRNVWVEGAEVAYDRSKESLTRLLRKEIAARRAEAEWEASSAGYGPRSMVNQLVHECELGATTRKDSPAGTRIGLLTFKGQKR